MKWIMFLLLVNGQIIEDPKEYTKDGCFTLMAKIEEDKRNGDVTTYKGVPIIAGKCELRIDV